MCCIPGPGLQAPGSLSPCLELGPCGFLEPHSLGRWEGRVRTCFKTSALSLAKGVGGAGAEGRRRTGGHGAPHTGLLGLCSRTIFHKTMLNKTWPSISTLFETVTHLWTLPVLPLPFS